MYCSNRDILWAITCGKLIVAPPPEYFGAGYDETSIDLHLGPIGVGARVWTSKRIAALTVATISSAPDPALRKSRQQTQNQIDPSGTPAPPRGKTRRRR
jgi:hypothetical protein